MPKKAFLIDNIDISTNQKRSSALEEIMALLGRIYVDERDEYMEKTGFTFADDHLIHNKNNALYYLYDALCSLTNAYMRL